MENLDPSEEKYRTLIDNLQDGVFVLQDERIVYISKRMAEMIGYTVDELLGKEFGKYIAPEDLHLAEERYRKRQAGEEVPKEYEARILHKNGTRVYINLHASVTTYMGKVATIATAKDITGRKRVEDELRQNRERLQAIMDNTTSVIYLKDKDSKYIFINKIYEELFHISQEEIVGKTDHDIFPKEAADAFRENDLKVLKANKPIESEETVPHDDGPHTYISVKFPLHDSTGKPYSVCGISTDITERKKVEEALGLSEEKYRVLAESIQDGIFVAKDGKFVFVNEALASMFGYTVDEIIGTDFIDYIAPEHKQLVYERYTKRVAGEDIPEEYEFCGIHKDGKTRIWLSIHVGTMSFLGEPSTIGTLKNITERRKADEKLREAKEEAEEATKLKDKFVSLVSHDLKSPLTTIMGFLQLLYKNNCSKEETETIIRNAINAGERMTTLIDDLLDVSRIKSGMLKPKFSFIDACYLSLIAIENYKLHALQKNIKLVNKIPERSRIFADEALLSQVIQNLISNAVKFCRSGDTITIRLRENEPSTIVVEDTGSGMEKKRLKYIFSYEEQTSTSGTAGEFGYGLGLPLVRDIMEAHGGGLRVESETGKGSAFYASLPFVRPVVLVVDDEDAFRTQQILHLKQLSVEIIEAKNGEDALEKIKENIPHLIITDINMPKMGGFALLAHIRNNPATKSIPVIVITGEKGMDIRSRAFSMGANDFVGKPLDPDLFIPRVRRFLA